MPFAIAGDLSEKMNRMVPVVRPRSDQAHLAAQNIDCLRKLIQTCRSQKSTKTSNSGHLDTVLRMASNLINRHHRAELDHGEGFAILTHSLLPEKEWPTVQDGVQSKKKQP